MELLSTHIGADFDGVAAMIAARRLHPEARLFFPGSKENSVRRMLETGLVAFEEVRRKEVDPAAVTRVILCDVRQADRIGIVADWLRENPGIEVWAYDHHPASATDLEVRGGIVDLEAGSASTLLAEELRRRGMGCLPNEATLLLMGIHEDTGSMTYATTRPRDLQAAAWLMEQGADLASVRRFAARPLDPDRLEVLHRMTRRMEVHRIQGHRVGVVEVELGEYMEELAPLVSRCLEVFDLPLLFALFGEGDESAKVTLIARGDLPGFDLGQELAELGGGGGHATAASARLKGMTTIEARERLLDHLRRRLPPAARARDLMIAPFHSVAAGTSVAAAKEILNARRINAAPVEAAGGRAAGIVTRQILDAALQHGLGQRPVETVMSHELEWVAPETSADEIGERMLTRHPRFVLVGDPADGRPLGLVTRMQLLRHLHGSVSSVEERIDRRAEQEREKRDPVGRRMEERLPPAVAERVEEIAAVSRRQGVPVYLVGGFVRDLLLERENRDLDVVVEGDGPAFAEELAREIGGQARIHRAFLTAVVSRPGEPEADSIDVATARSEFYRAPAALPEVQMSPLRQDLFRRDFTINTLAIRLGPEGPPELIDFFSGRRDLKERVLRVLHSLSFIDDPTRVLRAVRLELRLGFRISPETCKLIEIALGEGIFDHLSGSRLREELILLLGEPALAVRGIERLAELGLLPVLDPGLSLDEPALDRLRQARAALDWYLLEGVNEPAVQPWRLFLLALAADLGGEERERLGERLMLAGEDSRLLIGARGRMEAARAALVEGIPPHRAAEALDPLSGEELLLLMAAEDETVRVWVRRYLAELRPLTLAVRGADLVAAGVRPGPGVGEALRAVRRRRLDGEIGPEGELDYALTIAWSRSQPEDAP
jgi:tRNA nucleotidyltransferase (CCA-adding enzyme)